ncbi:cupin domain-containing protein [Pseudoflavitalea sp. G-6-1-2]|uniref:cupin domain-containing protein n=1 Tax=Pseudoflavitalea sp. G-6-1-2 TaxID=2728841 RepID=UPI00146CE05E|nr:cupin domain-containing protein [Pseudoflavitalea sp. G-6-1-2]NML21261.1 cupin domain-containing protein [Pseudoflavitalea sp. G-6-1-2]
MRQVKVFCILAALLLIAAGAHSQDYMSSNPKMCKLLGDTLNSKLMLVTFQPGEKTTAHTHPVHVIYALNSGTLRVAHVNGKTETLHIKAGQSATFAPEPAHVTTNVGKTPLKLILLEISQ